MEGDARSRCLNGEAVSDKLDARLLAKPSTFSEIGKAANVVYDFLHSMLAYVALARITPAFWVPMAATFLEGQDGTYCRPITSVVANMPWTHLAEGLSATFCDTNQSAIAFTRFYEFTQTNRIEAYYKSFLQLL